MHPTSTGIEYELSRTYSAPPATLFKALTDANRRAWQNALESLDGVVASL